MTFPGFYKERQIPPDFQGMEREKSSDSLPHISRIPLLIKTVLHFFKSSLCLRKLQSYSIIFNHHNTCKTTPTSLSLRRNVHIFFDLPRRGDRKTGSGVREISCSSWSGKQHDCYHVG